MDYNFIETWSEFILNETLKSHDINLTIRNINSELSALRYNVSVSEIGNNTISVKLFGFRYIKGNILDILNNLLIDRHGWFPSKMIITNFSGMINEFPYNEEILRDLKKNIYYEDVEIIYESKYDIEVNIPNKLYHLSIQEYEKYIIKKGLIPKSKSKLSKHLDRIYLCEDINKCYQLISMLSSLYSEIKLNKKNKINDKWVIYEVITNGLKIKLYKDPNYIGGYYVIDNIPSNNIKIIDKE